MPSLSIVATPIGNMGDITLRALEVLKAADAIVAEDTRVTKKLLTHYQIQKRVISWHERSGEREWSHIAALLQSGAALAYVTDAGTPGVSDPGGALIERIMRAFPETVITPLPGPSALAATVSVAGIPMSEFLFLGFLPHKKGRQTLLKEIGASERPVILFESVHRILKLLGELAPLAKRVIVCRELTKKFETIYRGTPDEVLEQMPPGEVKGEFTVIVYDSK